MGCFLNSGSKDIEENHENWDSQMEFFYFKSCHEIVYNFASCLYFNFIRFSLKLEIGKIVQKPLIHKLLEILFRRNNFINSKRKVFNFLIYIST